MNISLIKNENFYITKIELKGFKGTKEINNNEEKNTLTLNINSNLKDKDIILIYAENGKGKSTILENLHPYVNMISRDIKMSINYPAHKKITLENLKTKIECHIYWEDEKTTKGYIYINGKKLPQTEKGNITEYKIMIEEIFLNFNKFKTSLFMQQGVLEIVKAKPAERAKIINNFISPTISYENIKKKTMEKIEIIKTQIQMLEKEIENYKGYENRYYELQKINEEELLVKLEEINKKEKEIKILLLEENKKQTQDEYKNQELLNKNKENSLINIEQIEKQNQEVLFNIEKLEKKISKTNILENSKNIQKITEQMTELNNEIKILNEQNIEYKKETELSKKIKEIEEIINNYDYITLLLNTKQQIEERKSKIIEEKKVIEEKKEKIVFLLKEEDYNLENLEKYKKNQKLINALKSIKDRIKEEIKIIKEKIKENIIEIEIEKEEEELKNIENKIWEIEKTEKEIKELKNILNNIQKGEKEEIKCKCCKSILNITEIENHINVKEEKLEEKEKLEKEYLMKKEVIQKEKEKKSKITLYKKEINEKENELNQVKYEKLEEKQYNTERIIKEMEEYLNLKEKEQKIENNIKEIIKEKEETQEKINKISKEVILKIKEKSKIEIEKELIEKKLIEIMDKIITKKGFKSIKNSFDLILLLEKEKEILDKEYEENKIKMEEYEDNINQLKQENEKENKIKEKIKKYKENEQLIKEIKEEIKKINFDINKFELLNEENQIIEKNKEEIKKTIDTYEKDKRFIEKMMEEYLTKNQKIEELQKEDFIYKKIKIYSDRIKKAQVSNFFAGITKIINQMIETEDGSLKNLKVSITQKGNKNLNIKTQTKTNEVEDLSLLSGAEQTVVSRGISLALAKEHNFGIVYIDESDGALDKKNKSQFINTLRKTKSIIGTNQLFVISHNEDLLLLADKVIKF